jgi:glycosyltransferase involved in cell wall biosynthesis
VKLKKIYKVGVFLPVYNQEFCIERVIKSILDQDYKDIVIYIADDCSTDKSFNIISTYSKEYKNIKSYRNNRNLGVIANCNKLLDFIEEDSEIDLLCFTAGDDLMLPGKISKQVGIFDKHKVNYILHDYKVLDLINEKELGEKKHKNHGICNLRETISNGLPTITSMINFQKLGKLRYSNSKSGTDLYLHWKYVLSTGEETYYIPETLLIYGRMPHNVNASSFDNNLSIGKSIKLRRDNSVTIFKLFCEYPTYSFFRFCINSFIYYLKGYFHKR